MNDQMKKRRDKYAAQLERVPVADLSQIARDAWDAAVKALEEMAQQSFDEQAARKEYHDQLNAEDPEFPSTAETRAIYMAHWMHARMWAKVQAAQDYVKTAQKVQLDFAEIIRNQRAKIDENENRIAELEAALKFYVDTNNWIKIEGTDGCYQQIKDDSYKHSNGYSMGGKLARKALGGGE